MTRLWRALTQERVRRQLYAVGLAFIGLFIVLGYVTEQQAFYISALLSAIFAIPAAEAAQLAAKKDVTEAVKSINGNHDPR
jgi:uncharacterized membrane protein YdbT with pleckstrin-like domain